jgi:hypothetical protein
VICQACQAQPCLSASLPTTQVHCKPETPKTHEQKAAHASSGARHAAHLRPNAGLLVISGSRTDNTACLPEIILDLLTFMRLQALGTHSIHLTTYTTGWSKPGARPTGQWSPNSHGRSHPVNAGRQLHLHPSLTLSKASLQPQAERKHVHLPRPRQNEVRLVHSLPSGLRLCHHPDEYGAGRSCASCLTIHVPRCK